MATTNITDRVYHYTESELVRLCNEIREIIAEDMHQHSFLTKEQRNLYLQNRVLIGYKPSWFGRLWSILNSNKLPSVEQEQLLIVPISLKMEEQPNQDTPEEDKKEGNLIKFLPKFKK
jgi:hypothetical protein